MPQLVNQDGYQNGGNADKNQARIGTSTATREDQCKQPEKWVNANLKPQHVEVQVISGRLGFTKEQGSTFHVLAKTAR